MEFQKWFDAFLEEKEIPEQIWELTAPNGDLHILGTETIIDHIKIAPVHEQTQIKNVIVKVDFANGDINHFFKYLAQGLVNNF